MAESVFVLSLTQQLLQTTLAAIWNSMRKKKLYKNLRILLYSVMWRHIIWSGLFFARFFPSAGYPENEILCNSLISGVPGGAVGWSTALQAARRSRVRFVGIFHWFNPSGRNTLLGAAQPIRNINTRDILWGLVGVGWRRLGASTSWKPKGLSRPVMGLLHSVSSINYYQNVRRHIFTIIAVKI